MKTYTAKAGDINREWFVVDAAGKSLGRLASEVASILRGKRKPTYTPGLDVGDFVIVVNAAKVSVTGGKMLDKRYYRHSQYPGGLTETRLDEMLQKHPRRVILFAVRGMLPKTRLGRRQLHKLKVYAGGTHPHAAQQPKPLEF